jgi:starch synthase
MALLKLCILTSEMAPYAKTGGLADVVGAMVREFSRDAHEVRVFMPLYASVLAANPSLQPVAEVQQRRLFIASTHYEFSLKTGRLPGTELPIHFVDCAAMFDRPTLYTTDADEHRRFLLFTRAVIESCKSLGFAPDIFHCHDWHTAFLPLYLKTVYSGEALFARSRSVLTIHNIGYQGIVPAAAVADMELGAAANRLDAADLKRGVINSLKHGIQFADAVTTVSPTYAQEICAAPLGMGLEEALRARASGVVGILNGVDYQEWDPQRDPHISAHYGPDNFAGKGANKQRLMVTSGLWVTDSTPLIGMITRLAEQKGIDLLFDVMPRLLEQRDCALTVLGSGDARYVTFFEGLVRRFPGRAAFRAGFDEPLAHLIEAGSDMFLMPSHYEPCGLNQMYSLRYGTIPIVHRTGGLADSVQHFVPETGAGTGCVFNDFDAPAVAWALNTTLDWFAERGMWRRLMQNAMAQDFSWGRQIAIYEALFRRIAAGGSGP